MSKKIRFIKDHGNFKSGWVIGTKDSDANALIAQGIAVSVSDDTRTLQYQAEAPVQNECIAPIYEEKESAPKGAIFPEELEIEQENTNTIKKK